MAQKSIGPTFSAELATAGLMGLPFSWTAAGDITFGANMTPAQITAVETVYAAHDPTKVDLKVAAQAKLDAMDAPGGPAIRCFKAGIAFPADWQTYCVALRAIVNGTANPMPTEMPPAPAYPAGS